MMLKFDEPNQPVPARQVKQFQVRMPYAPPEAVGLGDVIARMTQALGIKPCAPCKQRQDALNRQVKIFPW